MDFQIKSAIFDEFPENSKERIDYFRKSSKEDMGYNGSLQKLSWREQQLLLNFLASKEKVNSRAIGREKRDLSISWAKDGNGDQYVYLSSEYIDCGNGYYYAILKTKRGFRKILLEID